ncbi:hypothetical protein ZIOFF_053692 [Zingiber officinale]|uniref:Uncharacterized protein n=1 Tax=Zingiber officinale TaxID=94328 RepID=A0A8J5KIS9_ZINOF|nr:hypothetical protein ZIOFF_053692 [Zingiber officinale]
MDRCSRLARDVTAQEVSLHGQTFTVRLIVDNIRASDVGLTQNASYFSRMNPLEVCQLHICTFMNVASSRLASSVCLHQVSFLSIITQG